MIPAGNHMFKVNNRNTRTRYEICSKLAIKTPYFTSCSSVSIVNIEQVYCSDIHKLSFLSARIIVSVVGNKAKARISKQVFQENKPRQIFRKTNVSYPLIRPCAYQGVRNIHFSENLTCFVFLKHPF